MEPSQTAGAEIVKEAFDLITGDRQNSYSHPLDDYQRTVNIYNALQGADVMTVEDGILFMVCMKLSRLMHEIDSGQDIPDNTRDAIGYLGCLNMVKVALKEQEAERQQWAGDLGKRYKTGESWA
jgi:hypothetical protein